MPAFSSCGICPDLDATCSFSWVFQNPDFRSVLRITIPLELFDSKELSDIQSVVSGWQRSRLEELLKMIFWMVKVAPETLFKWKGRTTTGGVSPSILSIL